LSHSVYTGGGTGPHTPKRKQKGIMAIMPLMMLYHTSIQPNIQCFVDSVADGSVCVCVCVSWWCLVVVCVCVCVCVCVMCSVHMTELLCAVCGLCVWCVCVRVRARVRV